MEGKKKYILTDETITYFGKTLYRIAKIETKEKGGFVEKEENLSQYGDAWVSGNAWVYGDAWVYGNAWVYGGKHITPPLYIQGSKHAITVNIPDIINIGCRPHTITEWLENYKTIGADNGYTPKQISEYGKYFVLIADILGETNVV